jgi:hypothetical protein
MSTSLTQSLVKMPSRSHSAWVVHLSLSPYIGIDHLTSQKWIQDNKMLERLIRCCSVLAKSMIEDAGPGITSKASTKCIER